MFLAPGVLFVHNPKAAGRSIRTGLWEAHGSVDSLTRFKIKYDHANKVSVHSPAARLRGHPRIAPVWDTLYRFGVVRNPWERAVSLWAFVSNKRDPNGRLYLSYGASDEAVSECLAKGFRYWLLEWCDRHRWSPWQYIGRNGEVGIFDQPQLDWFRDDERLVHDIFTTEQMGLIERRLSEKMQRPVTLPHVNRSDHGDYRGYYDGITRDFIGDRFSDDIREFGFT